MAVAYLRSLIVVVAVLYAGDAREADATSASARAEFNVAADGSDEARWPGHGQRSTTPPTLRKPALA